jgi:hypothetical protein
MDLIEAFKRTVDMLRSNLILFLPPLILAYLIPTALALAGLYILAPVLIIAANSPTPLSALVPGFIVAIFAIIVLALVAYSYVLAGWAEMNRNVTLTGRTVFADFWSGTKAYFGRILGGVIILALIYIVLIILGIAATFAVFLPLITSVVPGGITSGAFGQFPRNMPEFSQIIASVGNSIGVWLVIGTLGGLVFLFTAFWVQSVALDDTGVFGAIGRSISFVKNSFKTTLGIAALYIIAVGFTGAIFPGGGGGGGGGGAGGAYSFSLVIPAPLEAAFRLLIATFFVLYMFVAYADKKGKLPSATATTRRRRTPKK